MIAECAATRNIPNPGIYEIHCYVVNIQSTKSMQNHYQLFLSHDDLFNLCEFIITQGFFIFF